MINRSVVFAAAAVGMGVTAIGAPAVASSGAPASAVAEIGSGAYRFTVIADSADGYQPTGFGCPAMNEAGQLVFFAEAADGEDLVLRSDGAALTTVGDEASTGANVIRPYVSINSSGQVSFAVAAGPEEAIYRGDGSSVDLIAVTDAPGSPTELGAGAKGPRFKYLNDETAIADSGRVAFFGTGGPGPGLYTAKHISNTRQEYRAKDSDFRGAGTYPSFGDDRVAFRAGTDDGASGIYLMDAAHEVTTIVEDTGPMKYFGIPSLGAGNEVAFSALYDDSSPLVAVGSGGPLRVVEDASGPFRDVDTPAINASGDVAFTGWLDAGGLWGVYVSEGLEPQRVIKNGDALAGSKVVRPYICPQALNDAGQVAFEAELQDGRWVIVLAEPTA